MRPLDIGWLGNMRPQHTKIPAGRQTTAAWIKRVFPDFRYAKRATIG